MKNSKTSHEIGPFDHHATSRRMREWSIVNFGTVRGTAKAMKMSESNLQQYLAGVRKPGYTILVRLSQLGCDLNWLLTGKESSDKSRLKKRVQDMDKLIDRMKELAR